MKTEVAPKLQKAKYSLRLKLTVGLIFIISIIFACQNAFSLYSQQQSMQEEALINRETVARVVYSVLIGQLGSDDLDSPRVKTFLGNFFKVAFTSNERNRDLAFGMVVDAKSRVVAGSA